MKGSFHSWKKGHIQWPKSKESFSKTKFCSFFFSESRRYLRGLKVQPDILSAEQFRGGYISAFQFYNQFHAGFCSPYIHNPDYMLIVDFRLVQCFKSKHPSSKFSIKANFWSWNYKNDDYLLPTCFLNVQTLIFEKDYSKNFDRLWVTVKVALFR